MRFENPDEDMDCAYREDWLIEQTYFDEAVFNGLLIVGGVCLAFAVLMSL
jgi:hypothetical protein